MARWATPGLDINTAIQRLCKRHGTEVVLQHLRDWVAYMEKQLAIMERHRMGYVICPHCEMKFTDPLMPKMVCPHEDRCLLGDLSDCLVKNSARYG